MKSKLRFVIDTNVLVSAALLYSSPTGQAVQKANRHGYILQSDDTIYELANVLQRAKFDRYVTRLTRKRYLRSLIRKSRFLELTVHIAACSDPDDDKFLELAVSGQADYIIIGNTKDFPSSPFQGIPIITPAEFLQLQLPDP